MNQPVEANAAQDRFECPHYPSWCEGPNAKDPAYCCWLCTVDRIVNDEYLRTAVANWTPADIEAELQKYYRTGPDFDLLMTQLP